LYASLFFVYGYARKVTHLLAQPSEHVENGAFACVGITE